MIYDITVLFLLDTRTHLQALKSTNHIIVDVQWNGIQFISAACVCVCVGSHTLTVTRLQVTIWAAENRAISMVTWKIGRCIVILCRPGDHTQLGVRKYLTFAINELACLSHFCSRPWLKAVTSTLSSVSKSNWLPTVHWCHCDDK